MKRKSKDCNEYAIYKGDNMIFMGTTTECAEHFGVKKNTIYYWSYPSHHKRANSKKRDGKDRNTKIAIKL